MESPYPPFSAESVQKMLAFLPAFERGDYRQVHDSYLQSGVYAQQVEDLIATVYSSGFVYPFDWPHWEEVRSMKPEDAARADMLTLRKLMTAFVRNDRFCGGAMADKCAHGWIEAILRRLQVLAGELGQIKQPDVD
ncbi:MAG TPA: DUF6508 domain-containing protein [Tepidisphaeraceae bacterium]|jgi:hypothetical protein|nr:DUF6508 domain-containing protein [Tepidisphaeraceae bacterium]